MANPVGRPSGYKQEYCEMLIEHMAQGLSFESFAGVVSSCKQTLYHWAEENVEFLDAKRQGSGKSALFWEKLGMAGAAGMKIKGATGSFNASAWIFNMKNRFSWRDKIEHSGDEAKPLVLNYNLTDDDSE